MAQMSITEAEQQALLTEQQAYARTHSRFYREEHAFTEAADIRREPESFLCVSPKQIARVITLQTSGSTERPKRVFFTEKDIRQTEEFFFYGMQPMVRSGETAAVFMGGGACWSVSGLLKSALARFGASVRAAGFVSEETHCREAAEDAACLVGTPADMAQLAARYPALRPRTVLLSGERIPRSLRRRLERIWGAETFTHWGMCETGYGGAVEGADHDGLILRSEALLFEVIDPVTGALLPVGAPGEIVFSTLTREGMPLLHYRTGDFGRLLKTSCGSPRLDPAVERIADRKTLSDGTVFSPLAVDELAFAADAVTDCRTALRGDELTVTVHGTCPGLAEQLRALWPALTVTVREAADHLPFVHGKRI